jgi:hypothetical protein
MRSFALAALVAVTLCGCNFAERDAATCQSYGLSYGTPAYAQCMQNIAAQRGAMFAAAAAQQQEVQRQNTELWQREIQQNQPRPPTDCTTQYIGNQAYTHCN